MHETIHNESYVGSVDQLRDIAEGVVQGDISHADFFFWALGPYCSPIGEGLAEDAGHLIYRLSDSLSEEERSSIPIYPSDEGHILDERNVLWWSLEDWRREWAGRYSDIPYFQDQIG